MLFSESSNPEVKNRLNFFAKNKNGMILAEYDLQKRGAGDIYGSRQHGISDLNIASLSDFLLIEKTKNAAAQFLSTYSLDTHRALSKRLVKYQTDLVSRD